MGSTLKFGVLLMLFISMLCLWFYCLFYEQFHNWEIEIVYDYK